MERKQQINRVKKRLDELLKASSDSAPSSPDVIEEPEDRSDCNSGGSTCTFSDLPMVVLKEIVGKTPVHDCLALRKVNRGLRDLVDSSKIECDDIELLFADEYSKIEFDNLRLSYEKNDNGGCQVTAYRKDTKTTKIYKDDRDFKQAMIADASTFFQNPKLVIHHMYLFVEYAGDDEDTRDVANTAEFFEYLQTLNIQLHIRTIESDNLKAVHKILPFLNPEKLEQMTCPELEASDFGNIVITDAVSILKHPKLMIDSLLFNYSRNDVFYGADEILGVLESIDFQIQVESIHIREEAWIEWIIRVLRFSNQMEVEEVICDDMTFSDRQLNEIAVIEEELKKKVEFDLCSFPEYAPPENFVHFKGFAATFEMTDENAIYVRDVLLRSPHLKWCVLIFKSEEMRSHKILQRIKEIMSPDGACDDGACRLSIPTSRDIKLFIYKDGDKEVVMEIQKIKPEECESVHTF